MSIRKTPLVNGEYYHVFNRGVDKRDIFTNRDEMYFFFNRMQDLNSTDVSNSIKLKRKKHKDSVVFGDGERLVSIVAYCLLPNHFHLLLKQESDQGISKYMQRLGTSYVKFFNQTHDRNGSLFQGRFKSKNIDEAYSLFSISSYVNLNYKHHCINPKTNLVKSSIFEYLSTEMGNSICDQNEIENLLQESGGLERYKIDIKTASISFASNKGVSLSMSDFDF